MLGEALVEQMDGTLGDAAAPLDDAELVERPRDALAVAESLRQRQALLQQILGSSHVVPIQRDRPEADQRPRESLAVTQVAEPVAGPLTPPGADVQIAAEPGHE